MVTLQTSGVFIHPNALCETEDVGAGTRIWAFAHVMRGAEVGESCNICDGAYVEGEVRIGDRVTVKNQVMIFDGVDIADDVFLGPGVTFTNDLRPRAFIKRSGGMLQSTSVRRGATLGARSTVVCGVTVGEYAFTGAGAVVTKDVPAHALVVGNPARQVGWICTCGERLTAELGCESCGRHFAESSNGLDELSEEQSS
ncbi:MAG TPA: acyltransferase [Microlunatus sp.]